MSEYIEGLGKGAKAAKAVVSQLSTDVKNQVLKAAADALERNSASIILANEEDMVKARNNGMKESLLDRLSLNESRIKAIADGLRSVAMLNDPVGEVVSMTNRPNGLMIGKKRVPLGVVAVIYESRPNVTADAFGLCFKSGNVCILRSGSDAVNSCIAISDTIKNTLEEFGIPREALTFVEKTDREYVNELMKLNGYVDVIIPRGGAGLIKAVVNNSTVPVIETGVGNCHIYVDKNCDLQMAIDIVENAKTQRMGVCNAAESLVVHSEIADKALPVICEMLKNHNIEMVGDERACAIVKDILPATDDDFYAEFLGPKLSIKIVDHFDEAIAWINEHSTGHSEAIITKSYTKSQRFLNEIDSAAVYVNASTRFTDGNEFGFGAEIGISTQKLHARGPLGLTELTTCKYIIYGQGQIRK